MKTIINGSQPFTQALEAQIEELKHRHSALSHMVSVSKVGLCSFDTNLRYIYINDHLADINGLPAEDHLGRSIRELFPELADNIEEQLRQVIDTGKPLLNGRVYAETLSSPGVTRLYELNYYANKSADGTVLGISCSVEDITERDRVETAERGRDASDKRFRLLVERMVDGVSTLDKNGLITFVNDSACQMFGYEREEMIGRATFDLVDEENKKLLQRKFADRQAGDKSQFEFQAIKKNGQTFDVQIAPQPLFDENGDFSGSLAVLRDITAQKKSEISLQHSEAKFHAIFDRAGMAVAIVDSEKIIVQINKTMCDMLEYTEQELIGKSFLDITVEDDKELSIKTYEILQRSADEIQRFEKRYRKSDGSITWGLVAASKFTDKKNESYTIGMIQDITERKRAETDLRESEERLRQLAESLNEFIYLFDVKKMAAVYASPAYEKVYGRDPELLKNNPQDWKNAVHPEDLERVSAEFKNFMEEESADLVYRVVHPDGSIHWIHDRCFPIYDDKGELTRFAGVAEDITDRKMREERIERQNRRLRQLVEERSRQALNSERLASVGRLTAGYTHQIRNPLQSIFCNLDRIAASTSGSSPAFREIDSMRSHLKRIADVAKQLSYVHRPQESKITIFDVNDIITEAVDLYFSQISDAGIEISLDLFRPAAFAAADETVIYTALGNLILNAIDAMHAMQQGRKLIIKTEVAGRKVQLSVADTGIGISAETMLRIFDPFFTTKSPDKGTGLGLTVVRESLENSGGSITVSSELGIGTIFTIHLPVGCKP